MRIDKTQINNVESSGRPALKSWLALPYVLAFALMIFGAGSFFDAYGKINFSPDNEMFVGEKIGEGIGEEGVFESDGRLSVPKNISISSLSISADIVTIGLLPDKTLEVPKDPWKVGWYERGPNLGEEGTVIAVGHLDSSTGPAIFYRLSRINVGDEIIFTDADGKTTAYAVEKKEAYPQSNMPWSKIYSSSGDPELRLITCDGRFDRKSGSYSHNLVVYAQLSEPI
jgi:hypothetical protein